MSRVRDCFRLISVLVVVFYMLQVSINQFHEVLSQLLEGVICLVKALISSCTVYLCDFSTLSTFYHRALNKFFKILNQIKIG